MLVNGGKLLSRLIHTILILFTQLLQYQIQTSEMWSSASHAGYEWVEHVNLTQKACYFAYLYWYLVMQTFAGTSATTPVQ